MTGLDTTPHKVTHTAPPPAGFRNARPCSAYYGQVSANYQADGKTPLPKFKAKTLPYAACGYTGTQFRAAYEGNSALDGSGVTVAITDAYASPTIAEDANTYAQAHGDGAYRTGQLVQSVPNGFRKQGLCDPSGWYGEETLDVEAVHAMAPGARIAYYASASCFDEDFLDTLQNVVDDDLASLVSNSWSDLEENETVDNVNAYEGIFLQGAMQGIGFLFSSGDDGDEVASSGLKQVDYPASDPYVTAVGGTSDAIGSNGKFLFQTGWGTHKWSLVRGRQSPGTRETSCTAPAAASRSCSTGRTTRTASCRAPTARCPDVGLDGDPNTGMLIGETQKFSDGKAYGEFRIGGTSLASPLFAGMTALRQQQAGRASGCAQRLDLRERHQRCVHRHQGHPERRRRREGGLRQRGGRRRRHPLQRPHLQPGHVPGHQAWLGRRDGCRLSEPGLARRHLPAPPAG